MYDANNQRQIQGQGDQPSEEFAGASHDGLRQGEPFQRPDQSGRFRTVRRTRPLLWHGIDQLRIRFARRSQRHGSRNQRRALQLHPADGAGAGMQKRSIRSRPTPFSTTKAARNSSTSSSPTPPYDLEGSGEIVRLVLDNGLLREGGLLIFEHSRNMDFFGSRRFLAIKKLRQRAIFFLQKIKGSIVFSKFVLPLHSQSAKGVLVQLVRIRACHARGQGSSPLHTA